MDKLWEPDPGLFIAGYKGITTPLNELYPEIEKRGWEPKVDFKDDQYVATGSNPHGETLEAKGPTDSTAVGNLLLLIMRRETIRQGSFHIAQWNTNFSSNMEEIAKAYAKAPLYDPKAAPAWKELADDSMRRAEVLRNQLKIEEVNDPEPYESAQEMCEDVHKNKHFYVSRNNSDHPMWNTAQNVAFRIVHDVLGHCVSGGDFGWQGENLACSAHFPLLTPIAQKALFTECIAQTAAGAYFRSFMPQKVAFIDDYIEPAQAQENSPYHQGIHPSQTIPPTQMPEVPVSPQAEQEGGLSWATQVPNPDFSGGIPVFGAENFGTDPNANWTSGVDALPDNAYLWAGDPLGAADVRDNARKIDTGWANFTKPDGTPDYDTMRQAIVNAFRAVLLSPRKDLRANAIHYQDLMSVPATVSDPKRYWDTLEKRREAWNQSRGYAPESHKPYWKELMAFQSYIQALNPNLDPDEAYRKADQEFLHMWNEEEDKLTSDPKNVNLTADDIERKIAKEIEKRLKLITKPGNEKTDYGHEQLRLGATQLDLEGQDAGKYPAFMGSHLKAIAQISEHIDSILKASLEDIEEHDGSGHHFRAAVLSLGVPGVGPKVASLAWLFLQPMTSQLATIDTHMMGVLGRDYAKEMNDRDYYKFERELATGRDAAGYNHMPLGQFQWGMWDNKRTGPGTHQDHSALKVLDPTPHNHINWGVKTPIGEEWQEPDWWGATQPARDEVGDQWNNDVATQFPRNTMPVLAKSQFEGKSKMAGSGRIPFVFQQNRVTLGEPGETFMQLARRVMGLTTEQVWALEPNPWFEVGSYDPSTDQLFPVENLDSSGEQVVRDAISQRLAGI
jgi:hypothetical protein